ncbi:beta-phosphoglucomutase [Lacticaseibacillus rhamnosus]|uniref:beta-phosphoglucomutase n=1 Tax=Lacticaseibacillus rhamnosus TaxID=47715 RepID=UPI00065AF910|nr:beta-phosphoglucomutase [Lacticaseibacillus rhamnosus]KMO46564.1 beta-phosphoglucomutase [Lacticaseibacillus rhamnosus]OAU00652.1 beta-phosphoglucomutase [Lacticaseibacillus rhamnosus]
MLKGFIFDLDGVVTDSAKYHLAAWGELAKQLGITLPSTANAALRGRSRMDSLAVILSYGHQQNQYSEAEKENLADKKNQRYLQLIANMTPADILPGINQLLLDAKAQHLKLAIASASKNAPTILRQLKLFDQFDAIVDPASLHRGKPDPEIFIKAQHLLQLQVNEVASFEDASAGIAAINAAGQFSVGIGDAKALAAADYFVANTGLLRFESVTKAFAKWQSALNKRGDG